MTFGLLLSNLPHVDEARAQYDTMRSLRPLGQQRLATFWRWLMLLIA
ncbi:hypothetical protein AB4Y36_36495 [Paraburkholderia sp. BR10936]